MTKILSAAWSRVNNAVRPELAFGARAAAKLFEKGLECLLLRRISANRLNDVIKYDLPVRVLAKGRAVLPKQDCTDEPRAQRINRRLIGIREILHQINQLPPELLYITSPGTGNRWRR